MIEASMVLSRRSGAFIGDRSKCRSVNVVSQEHVMLLRENIRSRLPSLIGTCCLGPGLGAYFFIQYYHQPRLLESTPLFPLIAIPLCVVFCSLVLVRTLRWQRTISFDFAGKQALFAGRGFRRISWTRDLAMVTGAQIDEITRLLVEDDPATKANQLACYRLTLTFTDYPVTLFETTDRELTVKTAREICARLSVPLDDNLMRSAPTKL